MVEGRCKQCSRPLGEDYAKLVDVVGGNEEEHFFCGYNCCLDYIVGYRQSEQAQQKFREELENEPCD